MKGNTRTAPSKRSMLIGAIVSNDKAQLLALSGTNGKRVVVLDSFLDTLIWSSNGGFNDDSIVFVETDRYKQMWVEISNNLNHEQSIQ